jgi:flagellar biosynthesis/type III secretory pathway protein FliH
MTHDVTITLDRPIGSVTLDTHGSKGESNGGNCPDTTAQLSSAGNLDAEKAALAQTCRALKTLVDKLNELQDKMLGEHREEIAKLSVEIARKILMHKVEKGDYEIESIVKEALKNAPTNQGLVVRLNPEDLAQCQKALQDNGAGDLAGIEFAADANIGRAECLLESPKGIIESRIESNLEQIGRALEKVE